MHKPRNKTKYSTWGDKPRSLYKCLWSGWTLQKDSAFIFSSGGFTQEC